MQMEIFFLENLLYLDFIFTLLFRPLAVICHEVCVVECAADLFVNCDFRCVSNILVHQTYGYDSTEENS